LADWEATLARLMAVVSMPKMPRAYENRRQANCTAALWQNGFAERLIDAMAKVAANILPSEI
jgi:hypothetical protein